MKLFVGNLCHDSTESEVREEFSPFGPIVEFIRPVCRDTGQNRGFAFITVSERGQGEAAIEKLDGTKFKGRKINVTEAEDRAPSPKPYRPSTSDEVPERRVDSRPTDKNGKKIVYKGI